MSTATANQPVPLHHRKYGARDPKRRAVGWAVVILVHAFVLWAFMTGTAREALKIVNKPLKATVIQEVIIPPPPPPPPPPPRPKPPQEPPRQIVKPRPPKVETPPPFVPPAEVAPPVAAPAIQSVPTPAPAPPVVAPPAPPAPPAPAPTGRQEMGVACPTQVKPEMPRQAIREGTEGVVRAQALIRGGKVVEVTILSGPRVFHSAVRSAMLQYQCVSTGSDILATQEFNFRISQ